MSYSIFEHTMVDMTYPQIEEVIAKNGCVLLPVSVVEEHGPHLCTGTDIYLTQTICVKLSQRLAGLGLETVIAPPFYWGVNSITNGFTGSFEIKPQTMVTLLLEILQNLKKWGFNKIFLLSFHGDFLHDKTIIETVDKAFTEEKIEAYFINDANLFSQLGVVENKPYLVKVSLKLNAATIESNNIDIHAGAGETSWMIKDFQDLVDIPKARSLKPSHTTLKDLREWTRGGEWARKITPLGYCGNPADIDLERVTVLEEKVIGEFSRAIMDIHNQAK